MTRAQPEFLLKPKLLAVSVAACFAFNAGPLRANPNAPTVAHGSVGFSGLGTSALTITNQGGSNAIINWNGFSIGINELTKFQQFANLAVLNRVTGSEISSILGALQSDGRVYLINPNGIVFGASARIDVAGMVASSLNLSDQDFLSNRLRFTEVPGAGAVVNNGVIETATGGRVYLVAPTVENNGLIHAKQGEILLAAGKEVELVDGASPFVTVKVTAGTEQALNVGSLVAEGGRIGMFGALVRNSGTVEAGGAMVGPGGEVRLVATKDLTLDAGSLVAANGTSGGKVLLQAESGTNLVGGIVEAKGSAGKGGEIQALGVRVGVVGHGLIDASGETGGGTVLVGGDYQGKNADVQNAERTYIGTDGVIRADAMTTGDGGRVIVWADGDTRFFGSISARGGSQSGNGGFVETSGKEVLQAFGAVDTSAPNGRSGTWLLDPGNINIVASNGGPDDVLVSAYGALFFGDGPAAPLTSTIGVNSIVEGMAFNGSVVLQATEDIALQASVIVPYYGSLTMQAGDDIHLGAFNINIHGDLSLTAADARSGLPASTGAITSSAGGGNLTTDGGRVDLTGNSVSVGSINTVGNSKGYGGGAVSIFASYGSVSTGSITTGGGLSFMRANVNINAIGSIATGSINTSAGVDANANGDVFLSANGSISTASITTRSLHPSHGGGGEVGLFAGTGTITVSGDIDTRGSDGVNNGFDSPYYGGTSGGQVTLSRADDEFTGTGITVFGSILTSGGAGVSASSGFYGNPHMGGSGGLVSIGDWCDGFCGPLSGNVVISGTINTSGGSGGSTDNASAATYGGTGGRVEIFASGSVGIGSIVTTGGSAGSGSDGSLGNWGGNGGSINIDAGAAVVLGVVNASGGSGGNAGISSIYGSFASIGGNGGNGGSIFMSGSSLSATSMVNAGGNGGGGGADFASENASGGAGGYGGSIGLNSQGDVSIGTLASVGGNGGTGGMGLFEASGGDGGDGGLISITAYGSLGIGSAFTHGGNAGHGGTTDGGTANGGDGGNGGNLYLEAVNVTVGTIVTRGGAGGHGGMSGFDGQAEGETGGDGGGVNLYATTGSMNVTVIDTSGGAGGSGGLSLYDSSGGDGGEAGYVNLDANVGSINVGGIFAMGGTGGIGGSAPGDGVELFGVAQGGDGGHGYEVYVSAAGAVNVGFIAATGGQGGAGGSGSADASGGTGGDAPYQVSLYSDTSITAGSIIARGGNGGSGGLAIDGSGDVSGGDGGWGSQIYVQTNSEIGAGPIVTGVVDASAGAGGSGGSGTDIRNGGSGGGGSYVFYYGSTVSIKGPVLARGGAGGAGAPFAGNGGTGGSAWVIGTDKVEINVGGTLGAVAIDVSGGAGGTGYAAASPAGAGGAGGTGGQAVVAGRPDMTLYGSVLAGGGAGGAGGAGGGGETAQPGGAGGNSGFIYLNASTSGNLGDGIIYVLAGTQFNVQGGAGGADGGGGAAAAAGSTGTFVSMSDYFGTIVVLDPLSVPGINEGFQQVVKGGDDTTAFVGGEKEDEEEDKSQKELGSCKG